MTMVNFHDLAESKNQMLHIASITTGISVKFPAFVERFTDSFNVTWGTENSFGRIDPVKPYRSTLRRIQVAITVLAPSLEKGEENLTQYSRLIQMLYPVYSEPLGKGNSLGRTIKAPPILRVKMMNYIQSAAGDEGLLGCISGLDFSPDFNLGHFIQPDGTIIPKKFSLSFNFAPQHDTEIGFGEDGNFLSSTFPYGRDQPSSIEVNNDPGSEDAAADTQKALNGG